MLVVNDLRKTFGRRAAVDSLSLSIPTGQMVGIIGRSGAGKSTFLRLINRLIEPTSGNIAFDGADVTRLNGRELRLWRASCGMIFQQFNLIERMDVLTNVLVGRLAHHGFGSSMARVFSAAERATAIRALDRLDLAPQALQRAGTLSGGQQQRVAIARALVQSPRLLLADEPIASLDPANAARVMDALRLINREDGITVLVNLHTIDTARRYCDRIVAMRDGRIRFDGTPDGLTAAVLADTYGDSALGGEIDEALTSTELPPVRQLETA